VTESFWIWVASWAVMLQNPSDLGYEDSEYMLPPLNIIPIVVPVKGRKATTMTARREARKASLDQRVAACAKIVNSSNDLSWIIWCELNEESSKLTSAITGAVEIAGSHDALYKEKSMEDFSIGNISRIVRKPKICGYGMNFQICHNMAFVGLSDSFEKYYQAIRRCWRFGQLNPVNVYVITSSLEGAVVNNIKRKEAEFNKMLSGMIAATQEITKSNIQNTIKESLQYIPVAPMLLPSWIKTEQEFCNDKRY